MSMADDQNAGTPATGKRKEDFNIPASVLAQFAEMIDLILLSESMNDEERQYWFDILPVMNAEQVESLKTILVNERNQLAAIDAKYAQPDAPSIADISKIGDERRSSRAELQSQESAARAHEETASEELLKKMENI